MVFHHRIHFISPRTVISLFSFLYILLLQITFRDDILNSALQICNNIHREEKKQDFNYIGIKNNFYILCKYSYKIFGEAKLILLNFEMTVR